MKDEISRLRWQCRRGTKELDALLLNFLETEYLKADDEQQSAFALLLEQADPDLIHWLMGTEAPKNPYLEKIIRSIKHGSGIRNQT